MHALPMEPNVAPTVEDSQRAPAAHPSADPAVGFRRACTDAVRLYGGAESLALALGEPVTYSSKIYDALRGGRQIQGRWLVELLREPKAALALLGWMSAHAGLEQPAARRVVSREQADAAIAAEVDAAGELVRGAVRERAARRLGVRVEDLP